MTNAVAEQYDVLGVPISVVTLDHAAETIESWSQDDTGRFVCIRDVASLMAMVDDPELSGIHHSASMVTPDGMPLVLLGKLKGKPVSRTSGPDLMEHVCRRSPEAGTKHYFYGGKPGVAEKLKARLERDYPGISIVGTESPPFKALSPEEDAAAMDRIRQSGADIVWIGVSSPKQDVFMFEHYRQLPQTLIGVGAAFDFLSGEVARAPVWMQKSGLEWTHRLMSEPRRLWKRYLVLAPLFAFRVIGESLSSFFRSKAS